MYSEAIPNIVHEFAHCVSLRLNPTFANNPRWLWESVAFFEAQQYDDASVRPVVTAGPLPPFTQLIEQVDAGIMAGLDLEALKQRVKVTVPPGSVYATATQRALDAWFRIPAVESAFKEKV